MVVLSHMPVAALGMPTGKYPVVLAGHTFCGQVQVPGTPRLRWFNTEVLPGTADPDSTRIYRVRGATLFATCGVGFGFVPIRYGSPPEVALVTLRAPGSSAEAAAAAADSAAAAGQVDVDSLIRQFTPADSSRASRDTAGAEP